MSNSVFKEIPAWISNPSQLHNVFDFQLSSVKDISSLINLNNTTHFLSGLKKAFYWKRQLLPSVTPRTAVFSFLGPQGLFLPNITEIIKALSTVCNIENISEIYRAPNSTFIGFSFLHPEDVYSIQSSFLYFQNSIVLHVKHIPPLTHAFKLLWLPPLFPIGKVHHLIHSFSSSHSLSQQILQYDSNTQFPTNIICGTLQLSSQAALQQLPHLIPLPSPHLGNAFLIVDGCPPFCLRCRQEGHLRKNCPIPRCLSCHQYHLPSSVCSKTTYSSTLSPLVPWNDDHDFDDSSLSSVNPSSIPAKPFIVPLLLTHPEPSSTSNTPVVINPSFPDDSSVPLPITHDTPSLDSYHLSNVTTPPPSPALLPLSHNPLSPHQGQTLGTNSLALHNPTPLQCSTTPEEVSPISDTYQFITKQITRSKTSNKKKKTSISISSQLSQVNSDSYTGLFHLLPDEADTSLGNLTDDATDSDASPDNPSLSLSPHPSPSLDAFNDHPFDDSSTSSPRTSRKRIRFDNTHTQLLLDAREISDSISPSIDLSVHVDEVMPQEIPIPLLTTSSASSLSHNINASSLDKLSLPSNPSSIVSPIISASFNKDSAEQAAQDTSGIYLHPQDITTSPPESSCKLICLNCQTVLDTRFPLRTFFSCTSCHIQLTNNHQFRYYPAPKLARLEILISQQDNTEPGIIRYMQHLRYTRASYSITLLPH